MAAITGKLFGKMPDGTLVEEYTLRDGDLSCGIITYGGALRSLLVPDREGKPVDILLGFDTLEDYRRQDKYIGALIGRYANRVGGSRFVLEGQEYRLAANESPNHLHGGMAGFDKQVWGVESALENTLTLTLQSPDGQEGYPGNLEVTVTYTLGDSALSIDYRAVSDRTTLCNLTNHAYWNLSGHNSGDIREQQFRLPNSRYTPVDAGAIPTGTIDPVEGTPMDLRQLQALGKREYDHNWAIDNWDGTLRLAAQAFSPGTGIDMEVLTTLPGIQFYTGNFLDGCPKGKGGAVYPRHGAFCLETQYYPNSPNIPDFPSAVLPAGEVWRSKTVYRFGKRDHHD